MKKIIILIVIIVIFGAGIYIIKPKDTPKGIKKEIIKTNEKLTEDQVIDNILISNISLATKNKKTTFSAKITNLTANKVEYKNLQVIIKNKDKELATLVCYFGGSLNPEETQIVTSETNNEFKWANRVEFKLQN